MTLNRSQDHDTHQRKPYSPPKLTLYGNIYQKTQNSFLVSGLDFGFQQKTG